MKNLGYYLKTIILILFLPLILSYAFLYKDPKRERIISNLVAILAITILYFAGYYILLSFLFPYFFNVYEEKIIGVFICIYGVFLINKSYAHIKDIPPFQKKEYSKGYVDNIPKGKLWKFLIGRDNAIKFTYWSLKNLSWPTLVLGIIVFLLGIYVFFFNKYSSAALGS